MKTTIEHTETETMPFMVRPMHERDIDQSAEIERDAFPTLFPYTSFQRELGNKIARYLVAWRPDDLYANGDEAPSPERRTFVGTVLDNTKGVLRRRYTVWNPGRPFIAGFLGSWYTGDEAHIVSVGVRRDYRAMGIGELLLIAAVRQAIKHDATAVTLEVRPSNHVARDLYFKYGFEDRGLRKRYYSDNREDAIIMTTAPFRSDSFIERFESLVEAHQSRWGRAELLLV